MKPPWRPHQTTIKPPLNPIKPHQNTIFSAGTKGQDEPLRDALPAAAHGGRSERHGSGHGPVGAVAAKKWDLPGEGHELVADSLVAWFPTVSTENHDYLWLVIMG